MSTPRPIILVGLSGVGKTTIAELLAPILQTESIDLDARVEGRAGKSVAQLFAEDGEERFRALEAELMGQAVRGGPAVIAAGAGWAAQPGNLEAVTPDAFVVYLSIDVAQAAARLEHDRSRPLLTGGDLAQRLADQLAVREVWYRMADIEISVDGASPEMAAEAVAVAARQYGGW